MSPFARDLFEVFLLHHPNPDNRFVVPLRARRMRRVLVVGWFLTLVLAAAGFIATGRLALSLLWIAPLLIGWCLAGLVYATIRNVSLIKDADADERERAVRDLAHRRAYRILMGPFALATVVPASVALERLRVGDTFTLTPAMAPYVYTSFMSIWLLYFMLPTAVLAWTEPDPPMESDPQLEPRFV